VISDPRQRASSIVTARRVLGSSGEIIDGGALWIERGSILRVLGSRTALRRACASSGMKALDLGDVVITPGLVNAHSHLELSGMRGRLPRDGTFAAWIQALLRERAARGLASVDDDVRTGADRMIATGTTCTGDIDSAGRVSSALRAHPLRLRSYREVLDVGDAKRRASALASLDATVSRRAHTWRGISPHAPYTVSDELFREAGFRARARRFPVSSLWAETREEMEWMERDEGPLRAVLGPSPRARGLDVIAAAGLLGPRTALIHGNHAESRDRRRIAASDATLVHCPGTHAFFGRARFDVDRWTRAGVRIALGTDSLASNEDLDLRREMALLRLAHRKLDPLRVWDMVTRDAARALCFEGRAGVLQSGAWADFCAHAISGARGSEVLEALTSGEGNLVGVWIGGRKVQPATGTPSRSA
jgi:cytosine/adenosine deaminase-related metal-dependent hydrolase